jgi:phosphatidate cytidylyltransferase
MLRRALTALIAIPLLLAWLWIAYAYEQLWMVALLLTLVTGAAAWEYAQLLKKSDLSVEARPFALISALAVGITSFVGEAQTLMIFALAALVLIVRKLSRQPHVEALKAAAGEVLGLFYLPFLLQFFYGLFRAEGGLAFVIGLLVLVWAYDTGAFLVGRRWGRHKLAPQLSPGKTWEGVLGGALLALVAAALGLWILMPEWPWTARLGHGLGLSLLVSAAAQLGDLFESKLKRAAGVKDSGVLFPGHGGMLDRIDALLFALPVYLGYLRSILSVIPS